MSLKESLKKITDERWNIGFIQNRLEDILHGESLKVEWMKHSYKDRWFADPFILDVTDDIIHVLAEEFYKPIKRGRIAHLIIDRNTYELKQLNVVLELPTHLSYPTIVRKNGKVFICPENGESGTLNLYEYDSKNFQCKKVECLLKENVADATMTTLDGKNYLFCTKHPHPNGNILHIYEKNENGRFSPYKEYAFEENVARMAGNFFEYEGILYRPTQECNTQYGHAVTLQEVQKKGDEFYFKEVRRLYSVHPKLNVGMHTFNMYKGVIVTDALGFDNMWIRNVLKTLKVL